MLWQGGWPFLSADFLWHTAPSPGRRQTETDTAAVAAGEHTNRWENEERRRRRRREERDGGAKKRKVGFLHQHRGLSSFTGLRMKMVPTLHTRAMGEAAEKQKPYVFRHGMINKMFFFY